MSAWPQCTMIYDGSFSGFLSCVAESFRTKEYPFYFLPPGREQVSLYPLREVHTDPDLARSVYQALETKVSPAFRRIVTYSFLTSLPQKERHIFDVIYLGFLQALPQDRTDERLLLLTRAIRRLTREAQQWQEALRFSDCGGVLVGQIAPENRVLPLLRLHFCPRIPAFLIHDKTHREALLCADRRWALRPVDHLDLTRPDQTACRTLWQRFYTPAMF